jgi:long-chain acyl-CoA synthetase
VQMHVLGDTWIKTNDLAVLDEDGFLFCRGRLDGVISRGGFKIVPEDVAASILNNPGVAGAAVVGLHDSRLGEVPAALVELKPGHELTSEALKQFLRTRLPAPAVPRFIQFVHTLPRTISLKPDLGAARAILGRLVALPED